MSLTQALNTAMAGLQVTQSGLSVVAGNVANVQTPDYVRKTLEQIETANGREHQRSRGGDQPPAQRVRPDAVADGNLGRRLRRYAFAAVRSATERLWRAGLVDRHRSRCSTISPPPCRACWPRRLRASAQNNAINAARVLTQQLNAMSSSVQMLRSAAEQGISADVDTANNALEQHCQDQSAGCIREPE